MPAARRSIIINRRPDAVFAFLADGTTAPAWRPSVVAIEYAQVTASAKRTVSAAEDPAGGTSQLISG
jgi:hypothetical protein